jgi:hypothetical protein
VNELQNVFAGCAQTEFSQFLSPIPIIERMYHIIINLSRKGSFPKLAIADSSQIGNSFRL